MSTGPSGCSQYPAHPRIGPNQRWTFPGIGEFQCYDKFMLSRLRAVAQQASQPQWGLSGPHDAGSYCQWPHQTGFFSHTGSWDTAYGRFFLQLYSEMLLLHVDQVLGHVASALAAPGLGLHIKVPGNHWWYHHSAHPSELTAGIYNTVHRDGYLQLFKVAAGHGAGVVLTNADLRNHGQHGQALCGPEDLLRQQRTVAAALQLAVTVENAVACACDDTSLQSLQATLFERVSSQGIDLPMPNTLLFHTMAPSLFEPAEWNRFKGFARDVLARSNPAGADVARARSSTGASAGSAPAAEQVHVSDALLMAAAGGGGGAGAAPAGMASMWG